MAPVIGVELSPVGSVADRGCMMSNAIAAMDGEGVVTAGQRYLIFELANSEYGIAVLDVREIIGLQPVTSMPRRSPFVVGLVNVRATAIPVIDIRAQFGLGATQHTVDTCIIIVESSVVTAGLLADRVLEVRLIADDMLDPAPSLGTDEHGDVVLAVATTNDNVTMLLDVEKILAQ